jgi:hypothetical protein
MGTAGAETKDSDSFYSGKILFIPSVEASYGHDSNYFADATQEVSVNSYVVKPGFKFGYITPQSQIRVDYFLTANEYSGDPSVEDDDYYGHELSLFAETQATKHMMLGFEGGYTKSRITGSLDDLGNDINREKYEKTSLSPFLDYAFNDRWGMGARYTNLILDYLDDLNEDSKGHQGEVDLKYHLTSTSLIKLEYNIWNKNYEKTTPTYLSQQVSVAYEKEYQFFFLNAAAGYHDRQFDDATEDDFDAFVWSLSVYGEAAKARYFLSLDQNFNNFGEGQQYYMGHSIYALFGYLFVDKLDVEMTFEYQERDYQNESREDEVFDFSAQVKYLFTRQFSMAVKYGYERRDSNIADKNYDNNYLMLSADLEYDIAGR